MLDCDLEVREFKLISRYHDHFPINSLGKGMNPLIPPVMGLTNGLGDLGSIPGRVIPETLKMVLNTSLLNTQWYKVRIKDKVEQSSERSSALPYISV